MSSSGTSAHDSQASIPDALKECLADWLKEAGVDLRHDVAEWRVGPDGQPELVTTISTLAEAPRSWGVSHSLRLLPDLALGARTHAICQVWAAPMRAQPRHAAECVSQLWYGARVRLLEKKDSGWWRVQGPDRYLGYVHESQLNVPHPCAAPDPSQASLIAMTPRDPIALARVLDAKGNDTGTTVPVPRGSRLACTEEGKWRHPVLGLMALDPSTQLVPYPDPVLIQQFEEPTGSPLPEGWGTLLMSEATSLLGVPYLWGGTTPLGLDCSGLVQLAGRVNGVLFPRDASQQARIGPFTPDPDPASLSPGDLLFFGDEPGKYTHVALATGDEAGTYLHASGLVQMNSLMPGHPLFEPYRRQTWQGVIRLNEVARGKS